ncbi:TPA: hypothetical protein R1960_000825 [Staphylococcus delphini]|nr:hypothetical protein [Staphylococcus delphini]
MAILDLNNTDKLFFQGVEFDKLYYGGVELWKKQVNFTPLPLPNNKTPDYMSGTTANWTIRGVTPNKNYHISVSNVKSGIMRASQTRLGNTDLGISGVNSGVASIINTVSNPEGIVYVTMSDVHTSTPTLTISES